MKFKEITRKSLGTLFAFLNLVFLTSCSERLNLKLAIEEPTTPPSTDVNSNLLRGYMNVSWGDQIMIGQGDMQMDTQEKISRVLEAWNNRYNGKTILWRASAEYIDRYYERRIASDDDFTRNYYKKVAEINAQFNVYNYVRSETNKNGQDYLLYMTFLDHGAPQSQMYGTNMPFPWQDKYTIEHPEVQVKDRLGNYQYGVLEMAYPEARQLMVNRFVTFVQDYNADGVYVCPRTHSKPAEHGDQFGFGEPVVAKFKELYNIDILTDDRFNVKSPNYNLNDPMVQKWRELRGTYLVQFYRELRAALPVGKKIIAGLPRGRYIGFPYGNMYLDWETLVKEKLVDGIILGISTGNYHYPEMNNISASDRGYLCGEFENDQSKNFNVPSMDQAIDEYGSLCKQYGVAFAFKNMPYKGGSLWENQSEANQLFLNGIYLDCPNIHTQGIMKVKHNSYLDFSNSSVTIEAFVYPEAYASNRIVSKYDHSNTNNRGWEWILNPDGKFQFRVHHVNGVEKACVSTAKINLNSWTHIATVYDIALGEARIYINGQLDSKHAIEKTGIRNNINVDLRIGQYGGVNNTNVFEGKIDELRISNVVRTFNGIPGPYAPSEPGTVALFKFDKIESDVINDETGKMVAKFVFPATESTLVPSISGFNKALKISVKN